MKRMKQVMAAGLMTLAAGCQTRYLPVDDAGRTTAAPPPAGSAGAGAAHDTCGAAKLQYLVGKTRQQIPVAVDISRRRVVCTTCVMSHVDDPARTTIFFDEATGLVTAVRCQ